MTQIGLVDPGLGFLDDLDVVSSWDTLCILGVRWVLQKLVLPLASPLTSLGEILVLALLLKRLSLELILELLLSLELVLRLCLRVQVLHLEETLSFNCTWMKTFGELKWERKDDNEIVYLVFKTACWIDSGGRTTNCSCLDWFERCFEYLAGTFWLHFSTLNSCCWRGCRLSSI